MSVPTLENQLWSKLHTKTVFYIIFPRLAGFSIILSFGLEQIKRYPGKIVLTNEIIEVIK